MLVPFDFLIAMVVARLPQCMQFLNPPSEFGTPRLGVPNLMYLFISCYQPLMLSVLKSSAVMSGYSIPPCSTSYS